MKSVKIKSILIVALATVMLLSVGAFFGIVNSKADRAVSVGASNVFSTSGGAQIWAHRIEHKIQEGGEEKDDPYYYTMFTFGEDGDAVNYRRNLAYRWFYDASDDDDYLSNFPREGEEGTWVIRREDTGIAYDPSVTPVVGENGTWVIGDKDTGIKEIPDVAPEAAEGYLGMEIGFEEVNFDKFVITFEAQQYRMTKDEKTSNYIVFLPAPGEDGKLCCVITSDKKVAEGKAEDITVPGGALAFNPDHIKIALSGGDDGVYGVKVYNAGDADSEDKIQTGSFENVGGTYARNVSSTTKPVVPLSFKADMPEPEEGAETGRARMALYELNRQSFVLNRDAYGKTNSFQSVEEVDDGDGKKHYTGGQVNDLTPPVLCLDTDFRHIVEGAEINSYTPIDVLGQYPSTETGYFILTKEQAEDPDFNPEDYTTEKLYRKVKAEDDQYITPHANHYVPSAADYEGKNFGEDYVPCAAIKIYFKFTDTTSTGGQSQYIFLDWYVDEQYKLTINGHDYIAVSSDKTGAHYTRDVIGADGSKSVSADWADVVAGYQKKVDEAAEELLVGAEDFYLPSAETLIADNSTSYSDMTFSIYYMVNGEKSSATGKDANKLSIPLSKAGDYKFTIYAQDAASNQMWYLKQIESGENAGQYEAVKFSASEIWTIYDDEDLRDKLPWFTFKAGVSEITVEEPEEQETAYVGQSFTADACDIKGVSYKAEYSLYRFNSDLYAAEHDGRVLSYEEFMAQKAELFEDKDNGRKYFTNITEFSKLEEGSEEYEQFAKYNWNSSSRSFIPQDGNAFYLIKCEVRSEQFPAKEHIKAYMGIAASVTPEPLKGEDTWLKDNMVSIILLTIAGVAFIGIILLLVIKPKEKGDIDVQFEQEAAKSAESGKGKNANKR